MPVQMTGYGICCVENFPNMTTMNFVLPAVLLLDLKCFTPYNIQQRQPALFDKAYGEVLLCVKVKNDIFFHVRRLKCAVPTIILQVPPPTNPLLFPFYDDRVYGSFFRIVEETDQDDLVRIDDIQSLAVLIDCCGTCTVTDVLPFEHD